jgi:hypothetical protein
MKKGTTTKRAAHGLGGLVHKPTYHKRRPAQKLGK